MAEGDFEVANQLVGFDNGLTVPHQRRCRVCRSRRALDRHRCECDGDVATRLRQGYDEALVAAEALKVVR
jgi:hypothetical protein